MDFWEFVVRSEWPIVVGGAIWLLRRSLRDMFNRVNPTKVDAFGFTAEFERKLDKVEQLSPPPDHEDAAPTTAISGDSPQIPVLLPASPEAVILESWRQLEKATRQKLPQLKFKNFVLPLKESALKSNLYLTDDDIAVYQELRDLRNQVAYKDAPVSRADAIRYKEAAERFIQRLATLQAHMERAS